jgi:UTP--glucose-1-phosphate uridylyltransferase
MTSDTMTNNNNTSELIPLIIPAAGLGSRLFPITWAVPKELLPINNKPGLHYLLHEAYLAGIKNIICITSERKESLISYLTYTHTQQDVTLTNQDILRLSELNTLNTHFNYIFKLQEKPYGVGHAILLAEEAIKTNYFGIAYPDDILFGKKDIGFSKMLRIHTEHNAPIILIEKVKPEKIHLYGVIGYTKEISPGVFIINKIVEKPSKEDAPSLFGIVGRYIMPKELFYYMKKQNTTSPCNIKALNELIIQGYTMLGVELNGTRFDIGTVDGFLDAVKKINNL